MTCVDSLTTGSSADAVLWEGPRFYVESSANLRHWPEEETPAGICSVMEAGGGYVTSTFPKAGGCSFFPSYQRAPFLCSPAAQLQITSIFWRGSSICIWCPGFYSRCSGETLMVWLLDYHHPQANTHCSLSETICLSRTFGLRCKFLVWHTSRSLRSCSQGREASGSKICALLPHSSLMVSPLSGTLFSVAAARSHRTVTNKVFKQLPPSLHKRQQTQKLSLSVKEA